jgi:endoglycosylceramidase
MNKHHAMKKSIILVLTLLLITGQACKQKGTGTQLNCEYLTGGHISASGTRFIDTFGRQVIFKGINKVNKDQESNYTDADSAETYTRFEQWGFNCVRLGVIWDGVEPEPGKFDEKYLDKLEKRVNWAAQKGLYVLLDMHQDLYGISSSKGIKMGDGAPQWATMTDNQPQVNGNIWSDSYLISPAVQKAFDHFWANSPASDGVGIQDHYARMWQHVAKRFAGNKMVLGFDLMNEPFNGTQGKSVLPLILQEYARLFAEETGRILSEKEVMAIWSDEEQRLEAISRLQNPEKYTRVLNAATEANQQFEKGTLQSMYQRVGDAIRMVDTTHILFLEHGYFGNVGIPSGIEPVKGRYGKADPRVSYAPHGYDLLVDTKNYDSSSNARLNVIFTQIHETSRRIQAPVLVGEWGAFSGSSEALASSARFISGLFALFGFSNTYWSYYPGIEKDPYFISAIITPYPPFIAGELKKYEFNHETGVFSCSWNESPLIKAPTVIYIPDLENLNRSSISLKPEGIDPFIQPIESCKAGYLLIPVTGKSITRTIELKLESK